MKEIKLTQGHVALVDDIDYDRISIFNWYAKYKPTIDRWEASRNSSRTEGKRITITMSREILGLCFGDKRMVDHRNGDALDNRRINLRIATSTENNCNLKKLRKDSTSGYMGVSWHKKRKRWQALLRFKKKNISIGSYKNKRTAAIKRDIAAINLHGEFAFLNFPELFFNAAI